LKHIEIYEIIFAYTLTSSLLKTSTYSRKSSHTDIAAQQNLLVTRKAIMVCFGLSMSDGQTLTV